MRRKEVYSSCADDEQSYIIAEFQVRDWSIGKHTIKVFFHNFTLRKLHISIDVFQVVLLPTEGNDVVCRVNESYRLSFVASVH
jgi:hypothetical protein